MTLPEIAVCVIAGAESVRVVVEVGRFLLERVAEREASRWRNLGAFAAGAVGDLVGKLAGQGANKDKPTK